MNENIRDVTSKRPLTRVINVTSSQSWDITTFSTGTSCLRLKNREIYDETESKYEEIKRVSFTVAVQRWFAFPLRAK